jgi:hypothetical protein
MYIINRSMIRNTFPTKNWVTAISKEVTCSIFHDFETKFICCVGFIGGGTDLVASH